MKFDGDGMTDADNPETQRIMFFSASQRVETLPRHQARGSSNIEKHVTPMDPAVASKRKYDWGMMTTRCLVPSQTILCGSISDWQ